MEVQQQPIATAISTNSLEACLPKAEYIAKWEARNDKRRSSVYLSLCFQEVFRNDNLLMELMKQYDIPIARINHSGDYNNATYISGKLDDITTYLLRLGEHVENFKPTRTFLEARIQRRIPMPGFWERLRGNINELNEEVSVRLLWPGSAGYDRNHVIEHLMERHPHISRVHTINQEFGKRMEGSEYKNLGLNKHIGLLMVMHDYVTAFEQKKMADEQRKLAEEQKTGLLLEGE